MIKELIDDSFYKENDKYIDNVIDYCIIKGDNITHKDAALFAIKRWCEKFDFDSNIDESKMKDEIINLEEFINGKYFELFMNPPFGKPHRIKEKEYIEKKVYDRELFNHLNELLLGKDLNNLEAHNWSTDFSSYFDDGLEWWGAFCVSIYDKINDRYIVIGASQTD